MIFLENLNEKFVSSKTLGRLKISSLNLKNKSKFFKQTQQFPPKDTKRGREQGKEERKNCEPLRNMKHLSRHFDQVYMLHISDTPYPQFSVETN